MFMFGAIILQFVLIFLNAVFASAEIAVISTNETKLQKMAERGDKRSKAPRQNDLSTRTVFIYDSSGDHVGGIFRQCFCGR